ncbi:MAG: RdgB/HAM1 family non-canonical purine NTP pyrophosphatase [Candidatus Kapabacteria bacterium]|nr:RdgB/HAM1 family non-canonical purine NTP pyrophosphatase [Candidatus Kapabacteria bacterium]
MEILLASNNQHKLHEINQIFELWQPEKIILLTPNKVLINPISVEENGKTLEENALLKAIAFHEQSKMPCIADDTALEVKILHGEPGVYSARYAGEPANDKNNREKLLSKLQGISVDRRIARFRTVFCYKDKERVIFAEGICDGVIIEQECGSNGFGYDSIFIPDGYNETFAQMDDNLKNKISHRYRAAMDLIKVLSETILE